MLREPRGTLFPVPSEVGDRRLDMLARDVGRVLEQHGYPKVNGNDRIELEKRLVEFLHGSRGAAGELESRLNGTAAPLVSDEGGLDAYECVAVAHELRRKRGADGALVIAMDEQNRLHVGCAVEPQSQMDFLSGKLLGLLDGLAEPGSIEPYVLDMVVNEQGQAS